MSEIARKRLATIAAPYRREVKLDEVTLEGDMRLLRTVIREGHRITQLDIDAATAEKWGTTLVAWARGEHAGEATDDESPAA
ncbi:MAG: hypothetical protein AB1749_01895 [Pseudomonadota bacterium]